MSKVIRCLTTDATVMAMAMDATDMVAEAERIHHPSAVVTAALGRLLTASSHDGNTAQGPGRLSDPEAQRQRPLPAR